MVIGRRRGSCRAWERGEVVEVGRRRGGRGSGVKWDFRACK